MYNIDESAEELKLINAWRSIPYPMHEKDYVKIIVQSIKKLFVDVNHPDEYDRTLFITDDNDVLYYEYDFDILQEDGAISYTTDALSVTGAKEGYKSIQQELDTLERERIRVFHKMMARDTNET